MALANRVDPSGALFADPARGLFTGNRGVIHDPDTRTATGRRWTTLAWICCALDYKGRKRDVWGRNGPDGAAGWTELFFTDEVTALASGHRPCFLCRRDCAEAFRSAFAQGAGQPDIAAPDMDATLHAGRRLSMDGALKPARTANAAGRKVLGKLTVNLSAEVNEMVAMVPGFDDAVNLINDTVIANLQGSINATIAGDYAKWKAKQLSSVNA